MRKTRNSGAESLTHGRWGLAIAMILAGGVSIYAVADSRVQQPGTVEFVEVAAPVTAEEVAAFDPFHPQKAVADVAGPGRTDLNDAVAGSGVSLPSYSYDIPNPLAENVSEDGSEAVDLTVDVGEEMQIAAANTPTPAQTRRGRLNAIRNGSNKSNAGGNSQGSSSNGSNKGWVVPTLLIGGGAAGIALGTYFIVDNNSHNGGKDSVLTR